VGKRGGLVGGRGAGRVVRGWSMMLVRTWHAHGKGQQWHMGRGKHAVIRG
jgi:hypothetical protein